MYACPIGAMQAVSGSMNFKLSFYVIGFVLALGVVFGRAICGFFCPFGLIQELIYKIPFPKKKLWKWLTYVKYVLLAVFVVIMPVTMVNELGMSSPAFCEYICPAGTLEGGIPLLSTHPELRATLGVLFSVKACILIITLIGCLSVCRFFCKVMCPLGAIYGLLNKVSIYHMEGLGFRLNRLSDHLRGLNIVSFTEHFYDCLHDIASEIVGYYFRQDLFRLKTAFSATRLFGDIRCDLLKPFVYSPFSSGQLVVFDQCSCVGNELGLSGVFCALGLNKNSIAAFAVNKKNAMGNVVYVNAHQIMIPGDPVIIVKGIVFKNSLP